MELDQGELVSGVRYVPRADQLPRMTGGWFEGANNEDFIGATTLHTITVQPVAWSMNQVVFSPPQGPFRYLRFKSPPGGYGNVAEVEFDLAPKAPKPPLNLRITSSDLTNDFAVLAWDKTTGNEWTLLYACDDLTGDFGREVYVGMAVCAPASTTTKLPLAVIDKKWLYRSSLSCI